MYKGKRGIVLGKSIEERPESINNRLEIGHFEIDTVILRKEKGNCLLTLTDRKSRFEIIRLIPDKTSKSVNKALEEILKKYKIKSITADNGLEFARLYEVFDYEKIYYAHPYSSYERGTNENHNRLIRRFLPKGTKNTTHQRVAFIENWINDYPKKIFNYKTPRELFLCGDLFLQFRVCFSTFFSAGFSAVLPQAVAVKQKAIKRANFKFLFIKISIYISLHSSHSISSFSKSSKSWGFKMGLHSHAIPQPADKTLGTGTSFPKRLFSLHTLSVAIASAEV